ncbi:hypothetical protein CP335_26945 [Pseudomonas fluorescens]|uniref:Transmembrane protein n=1 Tax=Pseudomonas fluorescens TaxID=294 RepID=A0A854X8K4_PSEFL|nr:hypothetical protein [Pseudomonas fluorescens]PCM46525.1 hypothetical protein CP335_26945 [Pseudomonas fluorescens]
MDERLKLVICLIIPGAISIFSIKMAFKLYNALKAKKDTTHKYLYPFHIDANRGLAEQGYLWLSIFGPILYFLMFGQYSWEGYTLSVSSSGLTEFLKISTLPLGLLSLSIPLSILVARIHATHQTSVQIIATQFKNNVDGYYAHRKAMFEYFGALKKIVYLGKIEGDFHAHPRLHLRFFKDEGPTKGIPKIDNHRFKQVIDTLAEVKLNIHTTISNKNPMVSAIHYGKACDKIYELAGILTLPVIYDTLKSSSSQFTIYDADNLTNPKNITFTKLGTSTEELIGSYRYIRSYMRVLCEFSGYSVEFFDEKETFPEIDKGDRFKYHPYDFRDISRILEICQEKNSEIIMDQSKARKAIIESASTNQS